MSTNTRLSRAVRIAIGSAAGLTASLGSPVSLAQNEMEPVVITGSRIRQNPLDERLPVLTLGAEDYRSSGATSIAEFVQKLPVAGSAINRTNNSSGNLGFPPDGGGIGAGAAEMDLRYLASKRVLVLVDGRRWIKGSSGSGVSGAVDLNSIPPSAIKSIEILLDGASAVYGSDALGGVLNIITADDYDSFRLSGYTGQYDEGDGQVNEFEIRMGARGERARGLLAIGYTDEKDVNTADRPTSAFPVAGSTRGASSGTPDGRFVFTDPVLGPVSVSPNFANPQPDYDNSDPANDDFRNYNAVVDAFNFQPFNHLVTPNERLNLFAKGEYDVTDNVSFRLLASLNNRKSQGRAAPVPLFFGPGGGSTFYMANVVWPANHPHNPFGFALNPSNLTFIGRRPIEAGPRIFNQDVDTIYVSAGFDGQFTIGDREMYWDVTGVWAENDAAQQKLNQFNARMINLAMGDPAACAAVPGCVPLNIVGAGSMTQDMLDFVTYTGIDNSKQELTDVSANLSGELFDLPAGPVGFAIGVEHREEDGSFLPDPVVVAGETADVPTNPTSGGYDVDEVYAEVIVPLLKDQPAAESLSLSAAARYSDSSLFSSETGSKFGLNWRPLENLTVRASYSEGYRAPNIGELFNLGSRFDANISDPCSGVTPGTPTAANCAALGVPPTYVQLNPQISVLTGGNPALEPETSETMTFGFTWDVPVGGDAVERLLVEANYYDITIDRAIQPPVAQDLINACVATLEPLFCNAINRLPSGTIIDIAGVLSNIAGVETTGADLNFDVDLGETAIGGLRFQLMTSLLFDYDDLIANASGGFNRVERAGRELGSPTRGFVETKSTLNTIWSRGDFSGVVSLRYMSSLTERCAGTVVTLGLTALCSDPVGLENKMDSVIYADLQFSWAPEDLFGGGWTFSLGVNNATNESPPVCYSCSLNSLDGTLYPIAGQFWYMRAAFAN